MLAPKLTPPLSVDEFLAFVDAHPGEKWELIDGAPVAMAGGTFRHALIGANVADALGPAARRKGCRALRDMFFRIAANDGHVFDPDVMIRCGPMGDQLSRTIDDAAVVFEVLSPSTMARDRGVKLTAYQQAPGLRQIVLVYPGERRIESWARASDAPWPEEPQILSTPDAALDVPLIEAHLALSDIYEGVDFTT
jgi:Uma2 family endonuclease